MNLRPTRMTTSEDSTPSVDGKPRTRKERGAVLLEAAFAIPLLIMLMFGTLEAGMAFQAKTSATAGLRSGTLRAAQLGNKPETDLAALQAVVGEVGSDGVDALSYVIIFNADAGGTPESIAAACAAVTPAALSTSITGIGGQCVVYFPPHLQAVLNGTLTAANFDDGSNLGPTGTYTCDLSKVDARWCAGRRVDASVVAGAVNVGVAIRYDHEWFTGVLPGGGVTFEDVSISSTLLGVQA
jgi:Flp pilus assembly protein TadG